jgi:hypothetical protein
MSREARCNPDQFGPAPFVDYVTQDGGDEPIFCDQCSETLADLDREGVDGTCWQCLHPDCEDYPCQECCEFAADRIHDSYDQER